MTTFEWYVVYYRLPGYPSKMSIIAPCASFTISNAGAPHLKPGPLDIPYGLGIDVCREAFSVKERAMDW
jgi:hypothetical protein